MNKDAEGNEYIFRTPKDWGIVTGVLVPTKDGSVTLKKIDPESGDLKFTMHDMSEVPDEIKTEIVVDWIKNNLDCSMMPYDEDQFGGLVFNLFHRARDGQSGATYSGEQWQNDEILSYDLPQFQYLKEDASASHDIVTRTPENYDDPKTEIIIDWIFKNSPYWEIPHDESDSEGMTYNLVHLARDGFGNFEPYAYKPYQDEEIESWDM